MVLMNCSSEAFSLSVTKTLLRVFMHIEVSFLNLEKICHKIPL